jgi:GrpB-like predicted nucleotidyltransferase (UPF0157 family)
MQNNIDIKTETITLVPHDSKWSEIFKHEKEFLLHTLPSDLIGKIEHIGSTAILNIKAKPIVDILVEVKSQEEAKNIIAPILVALGYEHVLHDGATEDEPVQSSWFIKRNSQGERVCHVWCAEPNTPVWRRVFFVKYLNTHPEIAKQYENLKMDLLIKYPNDRRQYLVGKSDFINKITELALREESGE